MSYETIYASVNKEEIVQHWVDMCELGKVSYDKINEFFELYSEEMLDYDFDTVYDAVSSSVYYKEFYRDWA